MCRQRYDIITFSSAGNYIMAVVESLYHRGTGTKQENQESSGEEHDYGDDHMHRKLHGGICIRSAVVNIRTSAIA